MPAGGSRPLHHKRTLTLPEAAEHWSPTALLEKLIKIGAKVMRHGRYITFQMAEVAIPRPLFAEILRLIDGLRPPPLPAMTAPPPVASRSPDWTGICRAGRSAPSQQEIITALPIESPHRPHRFTRSPLNFPI